MAYTMKNKNGKKNGNGGSLTAKQKTLPKNLQAKIMKKNKNKKG